jgi:outer membrane receptor protein involved in Fe transport
MQISGAGSRRRWASGAAIGVLMAAVMAGEAAAAQPQSVRHFAINAQELSRALKLYALQSDTQILFSDAVGVGARSRDLVGEFTAEEGLARLLTGSQFTYTRLPSGAIRVHRVAAPAKRQDDLLVRTTAPVQVFASATSDAPVSVATTAPEEAVEEIVVTGSRITASGFTAPTPTTVIGAEDLANNAQPNIFTTIAQLPSLQGSTGVTTGNNSTSSGQQGLSSFALRGLGTIRTLTLLDGQRVVGANVTGVPDISLLPQLLVQRVDVVSGGASASYGSDAVGGVVNFITDKRFEGFKANVQAGVTTYGDNGQALLQAAVGRSFLNDRLHVQLSAEYNRQEGVPAGGFGEEAPNGRTWYRSSTLINRGVTNDGSPQFLNRDHAQAYQYTKYGLITAGPLQGIAFDANGQPFNFVYGSGGVPQRNAAGGVTNCFVGFCVGGDLSGNVGIGTTLQSEIERVNGYGRVGFDFGDDDEIYATVNLARVDTHNQPNPGAAKMGLTLQCANPYVPASIQAACAANNITSFQYGVSNAILPNIKVSPTREQRRYVLGADGKVDLFGTPWSYDTYYQHGENITDIRVNNITLTPRYNQAIQATMLNGAIVCANATARANGCQPINIIGGAAPSASALAYIAPGAGPFQHTRQTQDVFSFNLSGEPFSLWAGPISVATGFEYRREFYRVNADPYGAGVSATSPYSADYPADPILGTAGDNWYAGNYKNGSGKYDVYEGFLELNIPLFDNAALGKANLNPAVRVTDYSTSGTVETWKVGGTWDTPVDGLRFRAVTSRDVRAPNLSELFAAPIAVNVPNFTDPFRNTQVTILQNTIGNTALTPEISRNTEVGVVLSSPRWLPGFSVSVDYYTIKVKDVISSLSARQIVDLCFDRIGDTCGSFNLNNPNGPNFVNVQPFNLASIETDGFDIEASYRWRDPLGLPGTFTIRGLATHVRKFVTDTGIPGAVPRDTAGVNSGSTPHWKLLGIQTYDVGRLSLLVQERWFSDGIIGAQYVQCQPGSCPVSTSNAQTIDNNYMSGALYIDIGGNYDVTDKLNAYFKIDNLFDRDPTPSPQTNTGIDVNPGLYDTIGRIYRAGLRYNF